MGPAVSREELELLLDKLHYLTQGAELVDLCRLAATRRRRGFLRRGDPRSGAAPRAVGARHRGRAAPLGSRGRAVPRLAESARGRGARRPGVPRRRGLPARARPDRRARRRATCSITTETGCFALLREERRSRRFQAVRAARRPGLDGRVGRRAAGRLPRGASLGPGPRTRCAPPSPPAQRPRSSVGAGRFDPRQAAARRPESRSVELTPLIREAG